MNQKLIQASDKDHEAIKRVVESLKESAVKIEDAMNAIAAKMKAAIDSLRLANDELQQWGELEWDDQ